MLDGFLILVTKGAGTWVWQDSFLEPISSLTSVEVCYPYEELTMVRSPILANALPRHKSDRTHEVNIAGWPTGIIARFLWVSKSVGPANWENTLEIPYPSPIFQSLVHCSLVPCMTKDKRMRLGAISAIILPCTQRSVQNLVVVPSQGHIKHSFCIWMNLHKSFPRLSRIDLLELQPTDTEVPTESKGSIWAWKTP